MFVFGLVLNVVPHIQNCMTPWVRMVSLGNPTIGALGAIFNPQERKKTKFRLKCSMVSGPG